MSQNLTPEELLFLIEKMKSELEQAKYYLNKMQQDRAKIRYTLEYNQDNFRYLQVHCGIVAIDYVKNISNQMRRLKIFLKNAEEDIKKFEKNINTQVETINKKQEELFEAQRLAANKVIPFRRKQ